MNSQKRGQKGAVLLLIAVALVCLIAFLGLAIDVGYLVIKRAQMQSVADAVALSCASGNKRTPGTCVTGDTQVSNPGAIGSVDHYGFPVTVTLLSPQNCPVVGQANCVRADVTSTWNTFFGTFLGMTTLSSSVFAIAGVGNTVPCVFGLATTGINIDFKSTQTTSANCLITSNSTSANSISVFQSSIVSSTVGVTTAGGISGVITAPYVLTNQPPQPDPYVALVPPVSNGCLQTNYIYSTCGGTLPAGTYCGLQINPTGTGCTVNLSGTYVIRNGTKSQFPGISFTGGNNTLITGSNVVIYNETGALSTTSSNGSIDLTSPATGSLRGVLYWQKSTNTKPVTIKSSGGSVFKLTGIFYVPNAALTLEPGGSSFTVGDIIAKTIAISGSATIGHTGQGSPLYRTNTVLLK